MIDKFEWLCRQNSVVAEYLDKCEFVNGQYESIRPDPDNQWMADRLTGAYWAFCEQEKAVSILKADLEHYKRDGFAVVPVDPTPKMIDSTWDHDDEIYSMSSNERNEFIYRKMIAPYVK